MTNNLFQLDIETTGVDVKKDDILQISIVQMVQNPFGYYQKGEVFNTFLHTDKKPTSIFALENMQECYKKCNEIAEIKQITVRENILSFLEKCGCKGPTAVFCGVNVTSFDIPFIVEKGFLEPCGYKTVDGKEVKVGDFNYRSYEITGMLFAVCDAYGVKDRNELIESCIEFDDMVELPEGNRHDGLIDCLRQIKLVNGLLSMMRDSGRLTKI